MREAVVPAAVHAAVCQFGSASRTIVRGWSEVPVLPLAPLVTSATPEHRMTVASVPRSCNQATGRPNESLRC